MLGYSLHVTMCMYTYTGSSMVYIAQHACMQYMNSPGVKTAAFGASLQQGASALLPPTLPRWTDVGAGASPTCST